MDAVIIGRLATGACRMTGKSVTCDRGVRSGPVAHRTPSGYMLKVEPFTRTNLPDLAAQVTP